jgi:ankyrin repeat protein
MHGFNLAHFAAFAPLPSDGQLRRMLDAHPQLLSASAEKGDVPLHGAAAAGNMELVAYLLDRVEDVTVRCATLLSMELCAV